LRRTLRHLLAWLVPVALIGAFLHRERMRAFWQQVFANVRAFDLPTAGLYDTLVGSALDGFYDRVAEEVAEAMPGGRLLEVGSGPGRLAVRLVRSAPGLIVTGVDLSEEMVGLANRRAEKAELAGRARFVVGDVGSLPFADASFDGVVSMLSLHHWPDAARALAELHRVLKPGGEARIYDLGGWVWPPARDKGGLAALAAQSPFADGTVEEVRWPGSLPAFVLLRLRRP
jgi:SAM-dependent methyltransferase